MRIVRKAYVRAIEWHSIEIDEKYVESLNAFLAERCTETLPPITAEDIAAVVDRREDHNLFFLKEYTWRYPWQDNGHTWACTLYDMLVDIIDEDLWDTDYETEYYETDDWEDYVEGCDE